MRPNLTIWLTLIVALMGCSPALNWRSVPLDTAPYRVLLPCKPDHGSRSLPLGGVSGQVQMVGCEAGGALFAVSWIDLPDSGVRETVYAQWPQAMRANLRGGEWRPLTLTVPAALAGAEQQAWAGHGTRPDGHPVQAQGLWWQAGTQIFHAAVYADKLGAAMTEPFFAGIEKQ